MLRKFTFLLLMIIAPALFAKPLVGIIAAVPDEARVVISNIKNQQTVTNGVYKYIEGSIGNKQVVVLIGGAGIVNTAVAATNMIMYYNPKYLLFTGTAGGIRAGLNVGDVVIVTKSYLFDAGDPNGVAPSWPDFPPNPVKNQHDPVMFYSNKNISSYAHSLVKKLDLSAITRCGARTKSKVIIGSIASSDHFPNNNLDILRMRALKIDAVAMETASLMKVCWLYNKSCMAFRGISDVLDPLLKQTKYTSWNKANEVLASNNSGKAAVEFVKSLKV